MGTDVFSPSHSSYNPHSRLKPSDAAQSGKVFLVEGVNIGYVYALHEENKGDRFILTPQVRKVGFEIPFIEENVLRGEDSQIKGSLLYL